MEWNQHLSVCRFRSNRACSCHKAELLTSRLHYLLTIGFQGAWPTLYYHSSYLFLSTCLFPSIFLIYSIFHIYPCLFLFLSYYHVSSYPLSYLSFKFRIQVPLRFSPTSSTSPSHNYQVPSASCQPRRTRAGLFCVWIGSLSWPESHLSICVCALWIVCLCRHDSFGFWMRNLLNFYLNASRPFWHDLKHSGIPPWSST